MTFPIPFRLAAGIATGLALSSVMLLPLRRAAAAQSPTRQELSRVSPSGNYLAARHASAQRDAAAASTYYRAALRTDPKNTELLDRAFMSVLAEGDIDEAVRLAERVLQSSTRTTGSRASSLGVRGLKTKQYPAAPPEYRAIGARTGHRPDRRHADRLDAVRRQ